MGFNWPLKLTLGITTFIVEIVVCYPIRNSNTGLGWWSLGCRVVGHPFPHAFVGLIQIPKDKSPASHKPMSTKSKQINGTEMFNNLYSQGVKYKAIT